MLLTRSVLRFEQSKRTLVLFRYRLSRRGQGYCVSKSFSYGHPQSDTRQHDFNLATNNSQSPSSPALTLPI